MKYEHILNWKSVNTESYDECKQYLYCRSHPQQASFAPWTADQLQADRKALLVMTNLSAVQK